MNNAIFYPGMLKTFQECPIRYKYRYLDKIAIPQPASYSEKGQKIHALANFYLRGQDITKLQEALSQDEKNIFDKLKQNPFFNKTYVNSEYNLTCRVGNYWISGRIDALMKDDEGLYILDYKTGSIPKNPQYDFQTVMYLTLLHAFTKNYGINCNLTFVYIDLKNDNNIEIKLTETLIKEYERLILEQIDKINNLRNYTKNKNSCKFCEYSGNICGE